jgi:hypothetical protein
MRDDDRIGSRQCDLVGDGEWRIDCLQGHLRVGQAQERMAGWIVD